MRKTIISLVLALLSPALMGGAALQADNITIYDKMGAQLNEDNEVEPNCDLAQKWDLEAFLRNGANLKIVGGFNFRDGQDSSNWGQTFSSGDLFIDVTGDAKYGGPIGPSGIGYQEVNNDFGYDYAVNLDFTNNQYKIYQLTADSVLQTTFFRQNNGSDPFKYLRDGELVYTSDPGSLTFGSSVELFLGYGGDNTHYEVILNGLFSWLTSQPNIGPNALLHFTEGCGNDNLIGTSPVPIPGSLVLLGSGLVGLVGIRWRRSKK